MGTLQLTRALDWREAMETGVLGLWDLRPDLETVHYSPEWKLRLGFPEPHHADSTHFWRCRVHPDDLEPMLAAMRAHVQGQVSTYESVYRLRSNGSGYRRLQSRGRVVEWSPQGRALRMVGTSLDLTERPCTPQSGLPTGSRGLMDVADLELPFHALLAVSAAEAQERDSPHWLAEQQRIYDQVEDLLTAALAQLAQPCIEPPVPASNL
jgi:hypothetical protein